jgi:hypothetical protein
MGKIVLSDKHDFEVFSTCVFYGVGLSTPRPTLDLEDDQNIVEDIKIRRLGWVGHIIRMEEGRIPKKVLNRKFHNTRPVRRPRIRWEDAVQKDALQILGM